MTSSSAEVIDLGPMNSLQGVQAWHILSRCGQALANASAARPQSPTFAWAGGLTAHPAGYTEGR